MSTNVFLAWEPTDAGELIAHSLVFENDGAGVLYRCSHRDDAVVDDAWTAKIEGVEVACGTLPEVLATCQRHEHEARLAAD